MKKTTTDLQQWLHCGFLSFLLASCGEEGLSSGGNTASGGKTTGGPDATATSSTASSGVSGVDTVGGSATTDTSGTSGVDPLPPGSVYLFEYIDVSVDNPSFPEDSAFDVISTVTFTHEETGQTRQIEMFYDGGTTWTLRFYGELLGLWSYTTQSDDPELSGLEGELTVVANPDPDVRGLVTNIGNKWARRIDDGETLEPFVPQYVMGMEPGPSLYTEQYMQDAIDRFYDDHGFRGFYVSAMAGWVDHTVTDGRFDSTDSRDPDPVAFEGFERMIRMSHARGGVIHIWYCGDTSRTQSAEYAFGEAGAATDGERRLLRYIAARLGPVPGWVMGYGYDNPEHVTTQELESWGMFLREHFFGWQHVLGARDQGGNINYTFWPGAGFYSRGDWFNGANYSEAVAVLQSDTSRPHAFDERWWFGRLDEVGQRRLLWDLALAGGVSGIWRAEDIGDPYDNPVWFHTVGEFWRGDCGRLRATMQPAPSLSSTALALQNDSQTNFVFYQRDTASFSVDLSDMSGSGPAIAVNATAPYAEVDLGMIAPGLHTFNFAESSDWAVAVGEFGPL